eukprot:Hpha_TRINITY_DN15976_c1_g2::TRINITY_DN15976_c1_g2_i1::g.73912::m.73912
MGASQSRRSSMSSRRSSRQASEATDATAPVVGVPVVPVDGVPMEFRLEGIPEFPQVGREAVHKVLALAHLRGPAMPEEDVEVSRPPVRISAVVDRSGSMAGEKLELVKRTLGFVVRELTAKDEFGIIAYDDEVTQPLALTRMTADGKRAAKSAIEALNDGGCTNLSGGLLAGVDQVAGRAFVGQGPAQRPGYGSGSRRGQGMMIRNFYASQGVEEKKAVEKAVELPPASAPPGTVGAVWLFTDGMANAGLTTTPEIVQAMQERMSGLQATSVFTFGYGSDHNASMLKAVSEAANGMYYFIETPDTIPGAFAECLGGVLSVVAQHLKMEVKAASGVRLLRVLGQPDAVLVGSSSARLSMKDLYAEEERDLLVELEVGTAAKEVLADLTLSFTDARSGVPRQLSAEVRVERPRKSPGKQDTHPRVDEQRNRVHTADALLQAREHADAGRLEVARQTLLTAHMYVDTSKTAAHSYNKGLCEDLSDAVAAMATPQMYHARGEQICMQTQQCHARQRSCATTSGTPGQASKDRYVNARQKSLKVRFTPKP